MKTKSVIENVYEVRIGGTLDSVFLLVTMIAGLGASPLLSSVAGSTACGVMAAIGLAYFTYRIFRPLIERHLLNSAIDIPSHASPATQKTYGNGYLVGYSTDTGEAIYIDGDNIAKHLFVIGESGMGKSVLGQLFMFQQIMRGGGLLFIDGKLNPGNLEQLWYYCQLAGRPHDLQVISPGDPDNSHTYNPILYGDPDEVSARVLALIPSTENNPGADHYRQSANQGLATLVAALQAAGLAYNMIDLSILLMNANALQELENRLASTEGASTSEALKTYSLFLEKFREYDPKVKRTVINVNKLKETFGGIGGRLYMFGTGKFGRVMNTYDPDVKLYDSILSKKVVYAALPTMGKNEAANNFGKLILGDLRTAISWVQALPEDQRPSPDFFVWQDEQGSYITAAMSRPYEQARDAKIVLAGAIQTMANLEAVSPELREMILGNTWTKIYFKVGTPESALMCAEMIGKTVGVLRSLSTSESDSASASFLRAAPESNAGSGTGVSTGEREQEAYRVTPADLMAIRAGEVIMTFGGSRLYSIRIPRIVVAKEAAQRFGSVVITRGYPRPVKGADFFGSAERFLSTPPVATDLTNE